MTAQMFGAILALSSYSAPASLPACDATDYTCLKLHVMDELLQIQDLTQQLNATKSQLDLAKFAEQAAINAASVANSYAQKIQSETKSHWYEAPVLWVSVGFIVASIISVSLAAVYAHLSVLPAR